MKGKINCSYHRLPQPISDKPINLLDATKINGKINFIYHRLSEPESDKPISLLVVTKIKGKINFIYHRLSESVSDKPIGLLLSMLQSRGFLYSIQRSDENYAFFYIFSTLGPEVANVVFAEISCIFQTRKENNFGLHIMNLT
jgi:hypothetical protein